MKIKRPADLPKVEHLPPVSELDRLQTEKPTIFVGTIQGILTIVKRMNRDRVDPRSAFAKFGVVVVDEGHYEPAPEWSGAIRALGLASVLLTATPYRNDHRFFTLDENRWRFRFPHHQAQKDLFVRTPEFSRVDSGSASEFARSVVDARETLVAQHANTRVIVRADDEDRISELVAAFTDLGQDVLGVHHNFPPGEGQLRKGVPDPAAVTARYWVHQNKLIEGIDDPEFRVLAFFDHLTNDRAIVQQIGRVLRNPQRQKTDASAVVIGRNRDLELSWSAYEGFDKAEEGQSIATMPEYIETLLASSRLLSTTSVASEPAPISTLRTVGSSLPFRFAPGLCDCLILRTPSQSRLLLRGSDTSGRRTTDFSTALSSLTGHGHRALCDC